MSTGALWRLVARPATIFCALWVLGIWSLVDRVLLGAPALLTFVAALLAGLVAGQAVQELQHTSPAWMLPGLRRRLLAEYLLAASAVGAVLAGVGHALGFAAWPALAALGLFGFCLGGMLTDPLEPRLSFLHLAVAGAVGVWVAGGAHPLAMAAVSLAGSGLCLNRLFARAAFRDKPSIPTGTFLSSFYPESMRRYQQELAGRRRFPDRNWILPGHGTLDWVRAAFFEAGGGRPGGWAVRAAGWAGGWMLFLLAFSVWQLLDTGASMQEALRFSAEGFSGSFRGFPAWSVTLGLIVLWGFPTHLRSGLGRPISRRRHARISYLASALALAVLVVFTAAAYVLVAQLTALAAGLGGLDGRPLWVLRPILLTAAALPLAQGLRLRFDRALATGREIANPVVLMLLGGLFLVVVMGVDLAWIHLFGSLPAVQEGVLLGLLLAASQALFAWGVRRHYLRGDLA